MLSSKIFTASSVMLSSQVRGTLDRELRYGRHLRRFPAIPVVAPEGPIQLPTIVRWTRQLRASVLGSSPLRSAAAAAAHLPPQGGTPAALTDSLP